MEVSAQSSFVELPRLGGGRRILRTSLSGVAGTAVDVGLLIFLVELFGVSVVVAAFLSAMGGAVVCFIVSKYWAFRDSSPLRINQVVSFAAVALCSAGLVALLIHVLFHHIGFPYLVAKAAASAAVFFLWSYPAQSRLVFHVPASATS